MSDLRSQRVGALVPRLIVVAASVVASAVLGRVLAPADAREGVA